jgi:competence protein CoiA
MLTAIREDGIKVYADEVDKTDAHGNKIKYYCPECGSELILRQGTKNIWHFSHKDDNGICVFRKYDNESIHHKLMKKTIKKIIENDNDCLTSELEYKIGSRVADYYFEVKSRFGGVRKVAVECVQSHTDIDVFRAKNEDYVKQGVYVLWLFNITRFTNKDNSFKDIVRTNEILKESHTMYYGKVYALDISYEMVYAILLDKIVRENDFVTLYDEFGEEYTVGGGSYTLKGDRKPMPVLIREFIVDSFKKAWDSNSLRFLPYRRNVANVYLEKWW